MDFLKGVLQGTKKFFKLAEIKIMDNIPHYPEIDLKEIWRVVKANEKLRVYYPESFLASSRPPNRTFLFTVQL